MKNNNYKKLLIATTFCSFLSLPSIANTKPEQLYSPLPNDVVPELAAKGIYNVGVKTLNITNPAQFDVQTQSTKDRNLTIEVWYPSLANENKVKTSYNNVTRTGIPFSLQADAIRDAKIIQPKGESKYPLVVISHGYTGYRTLMFYLAEHLASHGYIVAAIDHTDSTNAEVDIINNPFGGFFSTLLNRSRDQQFTLNYFTASPHFAQKFIDKNRAGLIGYSMGGYGAVNTIGGCYNFTDATASAFTGTKDNEQIAQVKALLNSCAGGQYKDISVDPKWQSIIAMAPWGAQHNLFSTTALAKVKSPILYISGDLDDVSDYSAIDNLYKHTGSEDKYLLTYHNARHNIAPHPAPLVARGNEKDFGHYYEPSWNSAALNNTNKHFTLAMMNCHLKKQETSCSYLDLANNSNQLPINGKTPKPWKGFDHRYSTGMSWSSSN
jgi:predicted dienelactone hydrolase